MEIKIAEPIQTLEYLKDSGVFPFNTKEGVLYTAGSIDVAISTMNKYQKIKHIISKWDAGIYDDEGLCDAEVLEMISDEVYENGNAD